MPDLLRETPLVAVVGPTAVGKTAVGIALARRLNGEIVSADAVAVYRHLDIGAAKPTPQERGEIPFHLLDVADPDNAFTLAHFEVLAGKAIAAIRQRGKTPVLVGGTGLYVRAMTATLTVPQVAPQIEFRAALWAEAEEKGPGCLHERLGTLDPVSASKILPGDARRIIRALEVWTVTGQPLSAFHTPEGIHGVPRANTVIFGLQMNREALYQRIEKRVDAMLADGFVEEVRELLDAGYDRSLKSMQSLGYRHLAAHLCDGVPIKETTALLKQDTRRFAKRQLSWFNADKNVHWTDVTPETTADDAAGELMERLTQIKDTAAHKQKDEIE